MKKLILVAVVAGTSGCAPFPHREFITLKPGEAYAPVIVKNETSEPKEYVILQPGKSQVYTKEEWKGVSSPR